MKHLEQHIIPSESQCGFRLQRSCESQLFSTQMTLPKLHVDSKLQVDVAILKAFDEVVHSRLLYKLDHYGIRRNLLNWLKLFLFDRSQQVVVDGIKLSPCAVTSGVPQGSVLGPAPFLIYINDIVSNIQSEIHLFTDDILLYIL